MSVNWDADDTRQRTDLKIQRNQRPHGATPTPVLESKPPFRSSKTNRPLITQRLTWVRQQDLAPERAGFDATLDRWVRAKSAGDMRGLLSLYAPDFAADGKRLEDYQQLLQQEVARLAGRTLRLAEISVLGWSDDAQVRVVTFAQTATGVRGHRVMRQYWERRGQSWQIVYETALR